jgi:hypothetical protein
MIKKGTICNSKDDLIKLLEKWLENPKNITIGDLTNFNGNARWLFLKLDNKSYYLNADNHRNGVLELVKNHRKGNVWKVIQNNRGTYKKLTNDVNHKAIPYLYFYANENGEREI